MKPEKNKKYRIKGKSPYFKKKYGTDNPVILIDGNWKGYGGVGWLDSQGNPACILFAMRIGTEGHGTIPEDSDVYYGHIEIGHGMSLGELVYADELEEVNDGGN